MPRSARLAEAGRARLRPRLARITNLRDGAIRLREEELVKEFDQLAASPYVMSVKSQDGYIDIYTKPIFITHEGKRYEIGRFRLRLNDNGHIGITNVDNTSGSIEWDHPHIMPGNGPCFGNLNESLGKYLADRQFAVAVSHARKRTERVEFVDNLIPVRQVHARSST